MKSKHDIIWFDTIDSTNDEARRSLPDIDNLSVLSALRQTAGRGQRGNSWHSTPGENLMFSVVMKFRTRGGGNSGGTEEAGNVFPALQAYDQFAVSEIAALSVVDFLSGYGIEGRIKWPNDIYVGQKKICGILVENTVRGEWLSSSIVGIGLNVNQRNFDVNLPNPTSMALCSGSPGDGTAHRGTDGAYDIRGLLPEFLDIFTGYCRRYLHISGGLSRLHRLYLPQMWRLGQQSRFLDYTTLPAGHLEGPVGIASGQAASDTETGTPQAAEFTGTIRGINDIGQLLVELPDTSVRTFSFKEIGYML